MNLNDIGLIILDETSAPEALRAALDAFVELCVGITGIQPDVSFDAWADDSMLPSGVAINPKAAAHCAVDYQRSIVFIRSVYAAITTMKADYPDTNLQVLYAGCGPYATLLLPLLDRFSGRGLNITLLDIHQQSLDSVALLLEQFGCSRHSIQLINCDACDYQPTQQFHLILSETMQKSLEQEPQFAITANLAPHLVAGGVFIPQCIEVELYLANLANEKVLIDRLPKLARIGLKTAKQRHHLATVLTLAPERAAHQLLTAQYRARTDKLELAPTIVDIPILPDVAALDLVFFTRICVFKQYKLEDYECEITLPLKYYGLPTLSGGERFDVSYQLGSYPKFNIEPL
jgi:hypothetical protein